VVVITTIIPGHGTQALQEITSFLVYPLKVFIIASLISKFFSFSFIWWFLYQGWTVCYTKNGVKYTARGEGLAGYQTLKPTKFMITSTGTTLSTLWIAKNDDVEIRKIYQFDVESLTFTISITISNIGSSTLSSIYCKIFAFFASLVFFTFNHNAFCLFFYV
jgi:hypothetical protein